MKFLVIVNESPWGSGLSLAAWRFVAAACKTDVHVSAVFFREEGIYNALAGAAADAGTPDLAAAWIELAKSTGLRLLLCSSSRLRRQAAEPPTPFQSSGLTEMLELLLHSDRVVSF